MPIKFGELVLFDVQELAKKFNLSPVTVRAYLHSGKIKGRKIGKHWYCTEEALREYFNPAQKEKSQRL